MRYLAFAVLTAIAFDAYGNHWSDLNGECQAKLAGGGYTGASRVCAATLAEAEKTVPNSELHAVAINNLVMISANPGRYAEAEALEKQGLTIWEKEGGPGQPS